MPIAGELVDKGHDVLWRCGRKFEERITATGAAFVPIAPHLDFDENSSALRTLDERKPGIPGFKKVLMPLFIESVPGHVADIGPVLGAFRPDVVFSDHSLLAAPVLARRRGTRTVLFVGGPLPLTGAGVPPPGSGLLPAASPLGRVRDRGLRWLASHVLFRDVRRALRRSTAGLGVPRVDGFFMDWAVRLADRYLVLTVPEFEYPRGDLPPVVEFVGPTLPGPPRAPTPVACRPDVARARAAGTPVVLVTREPGTADPASLILPAAAALADEDVLVVATTGDRDPEDVLPAARRPANLRLERFVRPVELLPTADLVVTNGGYDSVQLALAHGVPLVTFGVSDNRLESNNRVRWSGAGVFLRTWRPEPARLRAAVTEVLADPRYRAEAGRLRAAYARHPGARRAAEVILEVAGVRAS
ncbi:nucleotide disphospho-sugar-binding domain-containing protein [Streptomyces millisiae]|uniref:Glycosyltransferase n=1 Tax=Streptomyces millisiae TaxID=3075542 RepID=A0ABU2LHY2_9ACTN|nr:nucleotide disphospho-sugar-binding domain-containing protein [Streptomyces sp. DSM 44918]MDT0317190.1 glycosyltransferase [Streptomyces sp. DSM 44918]